MGLSDVGEEFEEVFEDENMEDAMQEVEVMAGEVMEDDEDVVKNV